MSAQPADLLAALETTAAGLWAAANSCGRFSDQAKSMRERAQAFDDARDVVTFLVAADKEFDAAVADLQELNRRVAERGWIELEHDALRRACERVARTQARRADALDRFATPPLQTCAKHGVGFLTRCMPCALGSPQMPGGGE